MLFERWGEIARAHADDLAVRDLTARADWTFNQLAEAALDEGSTRSSGAKDQLDGVPSPGGSPDPNKTFSRGLLFPQGHSVRFILDVLRAWRSQSVVCPVEPGQTAPQVLAPPPG